ncbi:hypothetical protein HYR99_26435 [Candidatus Poribacteria bacterium]|nr:hypothetical protein [Candidatus Poribacteria bacterium]
MMNHRKDPDGYFIGEEPGVVEDVDCVIVRRKRTLAEAAEELQKYVKREYTDAEINDWVKQARQERWERTHGK